MIYQDSPRNFPGQVNEIDKSSCRKIMWITNPILTVRPYPFLIFYSSILSTGWFDGAFWFILFYHLIALCTLKITSADKTCILWRGPACSINFFMSSCLVDPCASKGQSIPISWQRNELPVVPGIIPATSAYGYFIGIAGGLLVTVLNRFISGW